MIGQVSLYKTISGIERVACILSEKCYLKNLRTVIIVPSTMQKETLNNMLWTYKQKSFIPHGSDNDPLSEKQPIFITEQFQNPNLANNLILINPLLDKLISKFKDFEKIIIIYDNQEFIVECSKYLASENIFFTLYEEGANGTWVTSKL
jgi:DNA polymerase III subunit chi